MYLKLLFKPSRTVYSCRQVTPAAHVVVPEVAVQLRIHVANRDRINMLGIPNRGLPHNATRSAHVVAILLAPPPTQRYFT